MARGLAVAGSFDLRFPCFLSDHRRFFEAMAYAGDDDDLGDAFRGYELFGHQLKAIQISAPRRLQ